MDKKKNSSSKGAKPQTREDRLKAALKANMGRRKAQARARCVTADGPNTDKTSEG